MDDKGIIDLYFDRSEKAISETAVKYGNRLWYGILLSPDESNQGRR